MAGFVIIWYTVKLTELHTGQIDSINCSATLENLQRKTHVFSYFLIFSIVCRF